MIPKNRDYKEAFTNMSDNLDIFVKEIINQNPKLMATDKWTVKEVLCHIVFWHLNYGVNYQALYLKEVPPLLDGPRYKLNEDGVKLLRNYSVANLIDRLYTAQASLYLSIVINKIPQMTYKKSTNRIYSTEKFLHLIERHLNTHTIQVRRAKEK
jgi:hypothetical protein